jgi:hypothetical protein
LQVLDCYSSQVTVNFAETSGTPCLICAAGTNRPWWDRVTFLPESCLFCGQRPAAGGYARPRVYFPRRRRTPDYSSTAVIGIFRHGRFKNRASLGNVTGHAVRHTGLVRGYSAHSRLALIIAQFSEGLFKDRCGGLVHFVFIQNLGVKQNVFESGYVIRIKAIVSKIVFRAGSSGLIGVSL